MTHLPSEHPTLAIHLSEKKLTPILTSSATTSNLKALSSLAKSALYAQKTTRRARLGQLQRIVVEYPDSGPVVLETFLDPPETADATTTTGSSGAAAAAAAAAGPDGKRAEEEAIRRMRLQQQQRQRQQQQQRRLQQQRLQQQRLQQSLGHTRHQQYTQDQQQEEEEEEDENETPLLVGLVVAKSPDDVDEATQALACVEELGREFQDEWAAEVARESAPGVVA
ncbi:hypothetical protein E4U54_004730 [Claviceps lovelessii]|nr:hypothetical protein E4U54_004730 [Claviceps lovelessii]